MLSPTEAWYRAKKVYSFYPGVVAPVSGGFLSDHYARRRARRGPVRAVADAVAGLLFQVWVPFRARSVQHRHRLSRQWRDEAIRIARARFADPNDLALFGIEREDQLDGYIRRFEDAGLNKRINPVAWTAGCVLSDKIAFARRCAAFDLRHPATIAIIVQGRATVEASPAGRPLLIKPSRGEGGRGVTALPDAPDDSEQLAAWLLAGRRRDSWIVQVRVAPHPALADVALSALPTARITTILNEKGVPEVVSAVMRLPSDPAVVVDNMKAGGLICPVDLDSGVLGIACKGYGSGDFAIHPVTGGAIEGRRLPDWGAACALVIDAHARAFGEYALIGWDVGFTPDGPTLIEGNGKPGVLMPQRAGGRGLGGLRYGELLAAQLAKADAARLQPN